MFWFRIDNRLIHGQVIETWIPYLHVRHLLVVNDALASDTLRQQIMLLAVPERVQVSFVSVTGAAAFYQDVKERINDERFAVLFLLADCRDALRLAKEGVSMPVLNIGNMHYGAGKRQICPHVAISAEDAACLSTLRTGNTVLDFRCIPGDMPNVEEDWAYV